MSKKLLSFLFITSILFGCKTDDESDTFWNNIETSNNLNPFIFVFSNTQISTCANHAQPKLERVITGLVEDVIPENVNGVMMFPSVLDPQYSNIAEELKFLFDQNGNNTFNTWPAYINNLTCYNIDSTSWYNAIKTSQEEGPKIKLGIKSTPNDNQIKVYVKGTYTTSISQHSIAVYAYRKTELANQETESGTQLFNIKNKVVSSLTPTIGTILSSNGSGGQFREVFTLNTDGENVANLGLVAVVYQLSNNKPTEVLNSIKLEEL